MFTKDLPEDRRLTVLLTGGRAPVTLDLARAFHQAGHRVLVCESARYHLCRVSHAVAQSYLVPPPNTNTELFLDALEAIVVNEQVDVVIPTCEEIFFIAKGLDRLSRHCSVWAAPIEQLRELHDKWQFVLLADQHQLLTPESRLIQSQEEWLAMADEERLSDSLVLKPAYSRFASRILYLNKEDAPAVRSRVLRATLIEANPTPAAPWIAQRRVYGRHISTYSIVIEGHILAHTAYSCKYRAGQGAAVHFRPIEHEAALEWVRKLAHAIDFTGQLAFDFIEQEDGELYAIECNPRATSGVHLFGSEGTLVEAFLRPQALRSSGVMLTPQSMDGAMIAGAMLEPGLRSISSIRNFRHWCRAFRSARDVVFSRSDLMPSIEQLRVLYEAWRISRAHGITLAQATTIDIEWNGEA